MTTVMPEISRVSKDSTVTKSLRVTIPEKIVNELNVQAEDILIWSIKSNGKKKMVLIVKWAKLRYGWIIRI